MAIHDHTADSQGSDDQGSLDQSSLDQGARLSAVPSLEAQADALLAGGRSTGSTVPDNWHVDPVSLGVPGVRRTSVDDEEANPLGWQADSLCAQTDPEAFFPEKGGSTRDAKKICATCDVKAQCLEYALQNDERFGIWGGLSERERRKLRRRA